MQKKIQTLMGAALSRILNFYQTSIKTFFWSSFIAFALAILSFPIWYQVFTLNNLPVQIRMSALGEEYVKVYWDNPIQHPAAYERIAVNSEGEEIIDVRSSIAPGDEGVGSYNVNIVDTPWRKLKFVGEGGGRIEVKEVKVNNQIIPSGPGELEFILPFKFWTRLSCAVFSTFISWLWMTLLFISTAHFWQGQPNKRFGMTSYIICLSITLSGFWMLVFYPAVMSIDALGHWKQALANQYNLWHPPILAMLMHVTQYFVKSPNLFSFIQGSLFWGSILALIRQVVKNNKLFLMNASFIILLPPLWLYSNATVSNTWMSTFALLSAAFLIRAKYQQDQQRRISFLLSIIFLSIAVCFRRESVFLVLVTILIYLYFWKNKNPFKKLREITLIIVMVLIPAKLIELSPNVIGSSPSGFVFLNPYVGTIVNAKNLMSETEIDAEEQVIDQKFGTGTFQELVQRYKCDKGDYIFPVMKGKLSQENSSFIIKRTIQNAIRHPVAFIKYKACNFSYTLQIPKITYQTWGVLKLDQKALKQRKALGIDFNSRLPSIKAWYIKTLNRLLNSSIFSLLFRHYIFLGISVFFLVIGLINHQIELIIISLFSVVYPVGYLVTDSFSLWRYLLLCYICSWIGLLSNFNYIILKFWSRFLREESGLHL